MSDANLSPTPTATDAMAIPDGATMSTPETLANIFFEPGGTFEALRNRPRFLVAAIIMVVLSVIVAVVLFSKVDFLEFIRQQLERRGNMSPEQIAGAMRFYSGPFGAVTKYAFPILGNIFSIAVGSALYMLGAMVMGGQLGYKKALSVWTYSSFPPTVIASVIGVVVILLKSADNIDLNSPSTIVMSNLSVLLSGDASPILKALLGSIDLLGFYGLYLAALGMRKVGKLSSGSAWTVVGGLWALGLIFKIVRVLAFGG